jgi:DNA-binding response OmpR family regulator
VDKVKSTFFANISHEFRTPLTLIKGPVQEMLEEYADHPKVKERMNLVQRNADVVLKLINQLLDLAKLESGNLVVEKSINDINSFLSVVANSFLSLAVQKNISLGIELPSKKYSASFDNYKVETILVNLINNAIKFTPAGGSVNVRAEVIIPQVSTDIQSMGTPLRRKGDGGEVMTLIVSDTGIGIDKVQHEKIFERFHQVSDVHTEVGTGIGLSLVKELVALMKGTLSFQSEPGKGSVFTVTLPLDQLQLLKDSVEAGEEGVSIRAIGTSDREESVEEDVNNAPQILVVEDNDDLRKFIIGSLGTRYCFIEAGDGKQGMEKALNEIPDLIISDVMMPEMDGITMTGKLKKDTRTSHIPLILLTAKTSDESKLSGLSTGADDYLTKPFNKQELLLKVRNSIALQVKLREKVRLELLKESPKVEVQSSDEKFLLKVKEAILSRLSDEQLCVESLAEEIALSRSQLLRKITALTGVSVNELIRTFRLQKAAQLLEQSWGPVTQVAYEVGFSNLSYFSKVFKEQYGVLPSDYLADGKKRTPSCRACLPSGRLWLVQRRIDQR